jgi:hypothetical protein
MPTSSPRHLARPLPLLLNRLPEQLGKVGVESAREMLASGMEMLPFRKREPMKKVRVASGPSWGGEPGREAGVQDGGRGNDEGEEEEMEMREEEKMEEEGKEEEEEEEEEEEDEGGDVKIADLLATQREAVTGYDGVLEPADEVMALRRERRDEGVSDYEESNESEEEENRRLQNVLYQKPEDVDSEEGSDSKDEKFDEFMRPVGEEWKNFRHPTGKQWEGVGPDQEDAKTHTQFSYVGMSVADVVNSKFEEVDNKVIEPDIRKTLCARSIRLERNGTKPHNHSPSFSCNHSPSFLCNHSPSFPWSGTVQRSGACRLQHISARHASPTKRVT